MGTKRLELPGENGETVQFAVTTPGFEMVGVGEVVEKIAGRTLEQGLRLLVPLCTAVQKNVARLEERPTGTKVKLNLAVSLEGDFVVVQGKAEGNLEVEMTWGKP